VAPSVQHRKVWPPDAHYQRAVGLEVTLPRRRTRLKLAGVPHTTGPISAASGPKFTILWGHVEEILLLRTFFPIVDKCLSCEDIAQQSCAMVPRRRFLARFCVLYFQQAACSTIQTCILNSHSGHTMCGSMVDIQSEPG